MNREKKRLPPILVHLLFLLLLVLVALPGRNEKASPLLFLCAATLVEGLCLYRILRAKKARAAGDIGAFILLVFAVWELCTTVLGVGHPVLAPTPEAVFAVFGSQWRLMLRGIGSSLSLLGVGFGLALPLGALLGMLAGWSPRLRDSLVPIARILAPIPAIIYAPYLIALMPTFRSASALVIVLGIFWPTLLQTVGRVGGIDPHILDSARALCLSGREMVFQIFLPYLLPGLISGLRVSLSTSFMLLTLAEMMGSSSGLGYFIKNFADYANYTNVIAGIFLVALVVTALNGAVSLIEKKAVRWK